MLIGPNGVVLYIGRTSIIHLLTAMQWCTRRDNVNADLAATVECRSQKRPCSLFDAMGYSASYMTGSTSLVTQFKKYFNMKTLHVQQSARGKCRGDSKCWILDLVLYKYGKSHHWRIIHNFTCAHQSHILTLNTYLREYMI